VPPNLARWRAVWAAATNAAVKAHATPAKVHSAYLAGLSDDIAPSSAPMHPRH